MSQAHAKDVVLEIIRSADGEWAGKSRLYKAFYFAHLYYANENPGLLTDWPIARMPRGPVIDRGDELLAELVRDGFLTVEIFHEGPYPEYRYRLTAKGRSPLPLPHEAGCAIKEATAFCAGKTAAELSQITHERSRSWRHSKDGDVLDIYLDTIPEDDYDRRDDEIKRLDNLLSGVFEEV